MYLARFEAEAGVFVAAALGWTPAGGRALPVAWQSLLLEPGAPDSALRVARVGGRASCTLFLTAPAEGEAGLRERLGAMLRADTPPGTWECRNAGEFDAIGALDFPLRLGVDPRGYRHDKEALACSFPLWTLAPSVLGRPDAAYQVHLRSYVCGADEERVGRKYLARLGTFNLFSDRVRAVQRSLAERTLAPAMIASEFVALPDRDAMAACRALLTQHFDATAGRMGFPMPPLEEGDYSDWLTTGRHPTRDLGAPSPVPVLGASLATYEEAGLMLGDTLLAPRAGAASAQPRGDVFISYSSADFAHALAACAHMERAGVPCWIAPRNINLGVAPYPEAILRGINSARALVVLVSATADNSVHVPREVELALGRRLPLIPVDLADVQLRGQLTYLLSTQHRTKGFGREFGGVLDELLVRVRDALGGG